jgi:hypothetical protein
MQIAHQSVARVLHFSYSRSRRANVPKKRAWKVAALFSSVGARAILHPNLIKREHTHIHTQG